MLMPDFGKIQSERVFNMRKFHNVEWNNFNVWTIIIRHHVKDQNYTQIVMFRCSECFLVN